MKILILSDTHGYYYDSYLDKIKKEKNIDALIFCGDFYKDASKIGDILNIKDVYSVCGNCDYNLVNIPSTLEVELLGKKFVITHGHKYGVKSSINGLFLLAKSNIPDIIVFGHTHVAYNEIIDGVLYFNPGSPVKPKDNNASYGIIQIYKDIINSSIVIL